LQKVVGQFGSTPAANNISDNADSVVRAGQKLLSVFGIGLNLD
jgi:hypothetical protein